MPAPAKKDTGVVQIHGKGYKTVALRVQEFYEQHSDASIVTEIVSADDSRVVMKATIYKGAAGVILSTGHAEEDRNATQINRTSALENAETSAVGRALAFLGLGGTEIASADEVAQAITQQKNSTGRAPQSTAKTVMDEMGLTVTPEAEAYAQGIAEAISNEDAAGLKELADELNKDAETKTVVWNILSREEKKQMKAMLGVAKA